MRFSATMGAMDFTPEDLMDPDFLPELQELLEQMQIDDCLRSLERHEREEARAVINAQIDANLAVIRETLEN